MTASHAPATGASTDRRPVTYFGPDFPFAYDDWIAHPKGLGALPAELPWGRRWRSSAPVPPA